MLGLSANLNYYLFNDNVDFWKGIFRQCESIRQEMSLEPSDIHGKDCYKKALQLCFINNNVKPKFFYKYFFFIDCKKSIKSVWRKIELLQIKYA